LPWNWPPDLPLRGAHQHH